VLAIRPTDLFEVGFQLSFAAVWALISIGPVFGAVLQRTGLIASDHPRGKMLSRIGWKLAGTIGSAALGTTAIALVTGPLVAYYFNYVSLVSTLANMALVLGVPLIFVDGFASAALAPIGVAGNAVGWAGTWVARGMLGVVSHLGSMKYAAVSVASPGVPALLGYYIVLYAGLNYVRSRFARKQGKGLIGAGHAPGDRDMDRGIRAP
jgi:competence protein ComEC